MDATQYLGGNQWLKAPDLQGSAHVVTVRAVTLDSLNDGTQRPCLHFRESDKLLGLNVGNCRTMIDAFGGETDGWIEQRVELYAVRTTYQGREVDGIRVRVPSIPMDAQRPAPSAPAGVSMHAVPLPTVPPQMPQAGGAAMPDDEAEF